MCGLFLNKIFRGSEDCSKKFCGVCCGGGVFVLVWFFCKVKKNNAGTRMSAYSLGCVNLTWRLKGF